MKFGIDVSYFQKDIDWARVKAAGVQFAIIRVAYGRRTDNRFCEYADGALREGLPIGAYVCTTARTVAGALAEADNAVAVIGGRKLTYPLVYDVEAGFADSVGRELLDQLVRAFCGRVRERGFIPCVYSSKSSMTSRIDYDTLKALDIDVWVAHYTKSQTTTFDKPYHLYQFSDRGKVDGIGSKYVDLDYCYKDYGDGAGEPEDPAHPYRRILKRGMSGEDVRYMKDCLVRQGYLKAATHDAFGTDTRRAVIAFQRENTDLYGRALDADGIIGALTWYAIARKDAAGELDVDLDGAENKGADLYEAIPDNIGIEARAAIAKDLATVSILRQDIVLDALAYAYDPATEGAYPRSLYIRGGNLYNADLKPNVMTREKLKAYLGKSSYRPYYSNGRDLMMQKASEAAGYALTGCDCSGGIVGLLRKYCAGRIKPTFDATANSLCGAAYSAPVKKAALQPGDWVGMPQHIGLYAGGGYIVEWAGGGYGCQLTKLAGRRVWDFVTKRFRKMSAWTLFRDPKAY